MHFAANMPKWRTALLWLAIAAPLIAAPAARAGIALPGFTDTPVASGFVAPTAIAFLPGGMLLVTEKGGTLWLVEGATKSALITVPVCTDDEMGLLGVAVDPDFAANGFVYLYRTKPAAGPSPPCDNGSGERVNQVIRLKIENGAIDPGTLQVLLTGIRTDNGNHDGGGLRIGPDGKLYVSVGDTGVGDGGVPGASTNPYSQSLSALEGKLLRVELDGSPAAGNPFIGTPGARGEIFAYGFRNPFRFGFDPLTGRLWLGDVGQDAIEELDVVTAGGNYAWPRCEGTLPVGCEHAGDIDPIFGYPHSGPDALGETIIAGAFADFGSGCDYFFADYIDSKIYRAVPTPARDGLAGAPVAVVTGAAGPVDLITGPDGAIYYVAINSGAVRRVAGSPSTGQCRPASSSPEDAKPPADTTSPVQRLSARRIQDIDKLSVTVRLNEPGTLVAGGFVKGLSGVSRIRRFLTVQRTAAAEVAVKLRLKLRRGALRSVRRALRRGQTLKARIRVAATDRAANTNIERITIRLRLRR